MFTRNDTINNFGLAGDLVWIPVNVIVLLTWMRKGQLHYALSPAILLSAFIFSFFVCPETPNGLSGHWSQLGMVCFFGTHSVTSAALFFVFRKQDQGTLNRIEATEPKEHGSL